MIVAVLAGGRGSRLGGAKALAELRGRPLISYPLAAARAFDAVVVAKPSTALPPLDVPVWLEPEEPHHPLCGLVRALQEGPVIAVACDQPFITPALLAEFAAPAVATVDGRLEPFPGHYTPAQLPLLREALEAHASLRATLARLDPPRIAVDARLVASVNTPEELAAAQP